MQKNKTAYEQLFKTKKKKNTVRHLDMEVGIVAPFDK